jgi:hypothetical protein
MKLFRRKLDGRLVEDTQTIENIEYSPFAGAQKNMEVGPALEFIGDSSAELIVAPGDQLFFFKSTTGFGWVEMSQTSGIGAVGTAPAANTFPIQGEGFTRYSAADYKYIKTTAGIFLYILRDDNQLRHNP